MVAMAIVDEQQSLAIVAGKRTMTLSQDDMEGYEGTRGSLLPRGWRNVRSMTSVS